VDPGGGLAGGMARARKAPQVSVMRVFGAVPETDRMKTA